MTLFCFVGVSFAHASNASPQLKSSNSSGGLAAGAELDAQRAKQYELVAKLLMEKGNFAVTFALLRACVLHTAEAEQSEFIHAIVELALLEGSILELMDFAARAELSAATDENTLFRELSPFVCLLVEVLKREPSKVFMSTLLRSAITLARRLDPPKPDSVAHVALFVLRQVVKHAAQCPKLLALALVRASSCGCRHAPSHLFSHQRETLRICATGISGHPFAAPVW